jgi:hypothetical protein
MPYWNGLWRWYEKEGGFSHVSAYLRTLDISAFGPKAPPRKTEAFWSIVNANRAPENSELADMLDRLGNPKAVTINEIIRIAGHGRDVAEFVGWLKDSKNSKLVRHRHHNYQP